MIVIYIMVIFPRPQLRVLFLTYIIQGDQITLGEKSEKLYILEMHKTKNMTDIYKQRYQWIEKQPIRL